MPPLPVGRGLDPELEKTLTTLKPGEISQPFAVARPQQGWAFVKLTERRPAKPATFESARAQVDAAVRTEKGLQLSQLLWEQKARASLKILDPRFQGLVQEYQRLGRPRPQAPAAAAPR